MQHENVLQRVASFQFLVYGFCVNIEKFLVARKIAAETKLLDNNDNLAIIHEEVAWKNPWNNLKTTIN